MSDSNLINNPLDDIVFDPAPIIVLTNEEWRDYWNPSKYVFYFFDHYN